MLHSPYYSPVFLSLFLVFQAVKPAWAAPENEVKNTAEQCIAPYQFIELQGRDTGVADDGYGSSSAVLGMYERLGYVHADVLNLGKRLIEDEEY